MRFMLVFIRGPLVGDRRKKMAISMTADLIELCHNHSQALLELIDGFANEGGMDSNP